MCVGDDNNLHSFHRLHIEYIDTKLSSLSECSHCLLWTLGLQGLLQAERSQTWHLVLYYKYILWGKIMVPTIISLPCGYYYCIAWQYQHGICQPSHQESLNIPESTSLFHNIIIMYEVYSNCSSLCFLYTDTFTGDCVMLCFILHRYQWSLSDTVAGHKLQI